MEVRCVFERFLLNGRFQIWHLQFGLSEFLHPRMVSVSTNTIIGAQDTDRYKRSLLFPVGKERPKWQVGDEDMSQDFP
jgi:hypothetical protein